MQRILERGEIEGLDHTSIPRLRQPVRSTVFAERSARLRDLASDSPLAGYLELMGALTAAQDQVLKTSRFDGPNAERIALAQAHGMPPLQAVGWQRDPRWLEVLKALLVHMAALPGLPAPAAAIIADLAARTETSPALINAQADAMLADRDQGVDAATAPFIMAALQVYWTAMAADFDAEALPVVSPKGVCPVCGSLPVASVVRVGGPADGCRYLCCSLCSSEWHLVRVTCSQCDDTKDIAYHSIEDGAEGIKAESCGECGSYRKIFYQEKDLNVDPVADDLASLTLDVLMGEEGFSRASGNPLLWQDKQEEA